MLETCYLYLGFSVIWIELYQTGAEWGLRFKRILYLIFSVSTYKEKWQYLKDIALIINTNNKLKSILI